MPIIINLLLILGAHFSATPFAPAKDNSWLLWPFDTRTRPFAPFLGGLHAAAPLLAGVAFIGFAAAVTGRFGWWVPAPWITPAATAGAVFSILLYALYLSPFSAIPLVLNGVVLWLALTGRIS